jgi:hypothetical protein
LAEIDGDPPAELCEALASALKEQAAEQRRIEGLKHLEKQWDPLAGKRTRFLLVAMTGTVWTALPLLQWKGPLFGGWSTYRGLFTWSATMTVLMVGLGV